MSGLCISRTDDCRSTGNSAVYDLKHQDKALGCERQDEGNRIIVPPTFVELWNLVMEHSEVLIFGLLVKVAHRLFPTRSIVSERKSVTFILLFKRSKGSKYIE